MNHSSINPYFQREMQILSEATHDYVKQFPKQAFDLNLDTSRDQNPHVSRLLEGCAYLNAQVRQQIDLGIGHVSESFIRQMAPQMLRPFPSRTIVALSVSSQNCQEPRHIPAGVAFHSPAVGPEQIICRFKTTRPIQVYPMELTQVTMTQHVGNRASILLNFSMFENVLLESMKGAKLPIYIHAPSDIAPLWQELFFNKLVKIEVQQGDHIQYVGHCIQDIDHSCDIRQQEAAFGAAGEAFDYLRGSLMFPEKMGFFELDLSRVSWRHSQFQVRFEFQASISDWRIHKDLFYLNCVPAINLFESTAEPICYRGEESRYPIHLSYEKPESLALFDLSQVTALPRQGKQALTIKNFYRSPMSQSHQPHYLHRQWMDGKTVKHELHFSQLGAQKMHISCDVLVCQGQHPHQYLMPNEMFLADDKYLGLLKGTNITRPSEVFHPPLSKHYLNACMLQLNAGIETFKNISLFQTILKDQDQFERYTGCIEAMEEVEIKLVRSIRKGVMIRQVRVDFLLSEKEIQSLSLLHQFWRIIDGYVRFFRPMHTGLETRLITSSGSRLFGRT